MQGRETCVSLRPSMYSIGPLSFTYKIHPVERNRYIRTHIKANTEIEDTCED